MPKIPKRSNEECRTIIVEVRTSQTSQITKPILVNNEFKLEGGGSIEFLNFDVQLFVPNAFSLRWSKCIIHYTVE